MVTLIKTWYIDTNVVPSNQATAAAQQARQVLNPKLFMTGAALYEDGVRVPDGSGQPGVATITRSSNSVTAGAADNWNGAGDIVFAAAGVAHSWAVLRITTGATFFEILIDCIPAGTEQITVSMAPGSNPFTGGSITTAPALPTNGVLFAVTQISENNPTLAPHRAHFWRSSVFDFWLFWSRDGSTVFGAMLWVLQGVGGQAGDVYPVGPGIVGGNMTTSAPTIANIQGAANCAGWSTDNTNRDTIPCVMKGTGTNVASTGFGTSGGLIGGLNAAGEIELWQLDATLGVFRGRVEDIRYGSTAQANLNLQPSADVYKYLNIGEFVGFKHDTDTTPVL